MSAQDELENLQQSIEDDSSTGSESDDHNHCCHHHHQKPYTETDPIVLEMFDKTNDIFDALENVSDQEYEELFKKYSSILLIDNNKEEIQSLLVELLSDFKYGRDRNFHGKIWCLARAYLLIAKFWSLLFRNPEEEDEIENLQYYQDLFPKNLDEKVLGKCIGYSFAWINVIYPPALVEYEPYLTSLINTGKLTIGDLWLEKGLEIVSFISKHGKMNIKGAPLHFNKRTISQFRGDIFVIGDPHNNSTVRPERCFTLDIDIKENPDVVGDAFNERTIMPFPNNRFAQIIFNFIGHNILLTKTVLLQYHRILRHSGTLTFRTEHDKRLAEIDKIYQRRFEMESNLWNTGFCNISITIHIDNETTVWAPYYLLVEARKS